MARVPVRPLLAHHHEFEYGPADYGRVSAGIRRISWGAIAAGAAVALAVQLGVGTLGAAIGIGGDATWGGAWMLGSALLTMFVGGLVAGRLAGMPRLGDGGLHGFVTWALATLLGVTLLAAALAPPAEPAAEPAPEPAAIAAPAEPADLSAIQAEAAALLFADSTETPEGVALKAAIDDALGGPAAPTDTQQDDLAAALAAATGLTEVQARQTVGRWVMQVNEARGGGLELMAPLEVDTSPTTSSAALWSALALALGALAAALGGAAGTPTPLPVAPTVAAEDSVFTEPLAS